MTRRFRRKVDPDSGDSGTAIGRVPKGVYWTVLAVLVVLLVLGYDRREQREARDHIAAAEQLQGKEDYTAALAEYRKALENPRLGRKEKAHLALNIAEIYHAKFQDYDLASAYYTRARHLYPKSVDTPEVRARIKAARDRASSSALHDSATTAPVSDRVLLVSPPESDAQGPVIARYRGRDIHAGELERALRSLSGYRGILIQPDEKKLEKIIEDYLDRDLAYQAALDNDYQFAPDLNARIYEYQRAILIERFLQDARQKAQTVTNEDVEKFWQENRDRYVEPEKISVGLIKTNTEADARKVIQLVEEGMAWGDAATSMSVDADLVTQRGIAGTITAKDSSIPQVGEAPDVVKTLMEMEQGALSEPVKIENEYCVFRVVTRLPRHESTLDEVRGQIETIIRSQKASSSNKSTAGVLRSEYGLEIDPRAQKLLVAHAREMERQAETAQTTETAPSSRPSPRKERPRAR
jgi:tetratricopeptide (TPR) repeat protein